MRILLKGLAAIPHAANHLTEARGVDDDVAGNLADAPVGKGAGHFPESFLRQGWIATADQQEITGKAPALGPGRRGKTGGKAMIRSPDFQGARGGYQLGGGCRYHRTIGMKGGDDRAAFQIDNHGRDRRAL